MMSAASSTAVTQGRPLVVPAAAAMALLRPLMGVLPQLSRYTLVSGGAAALDFLVYLMLIADTWPAPLAGAAGYAFGLVLHYALSIRFVFDCRRAAKSGTRLLIEFALTGLVGLALTAGIIAVAVDGLHLSPALAKACAAVLCFLAVFVLRRAVVFGGR